MRTLKVGIGSIGLAALAAGWLTVRGLRGLRARFGVWPMATVALLVAFAAANPVNADRPEIVRVETIGSDAVAPASEGTFGERIVQPHQPASAPSATLADPGPTIDLGEPTTTMTDRPGAGAVHTTTPRRKSTTTAAPAPTAPPAVAETAPAAPAAFDWRTLPMCAHENDSECIWLAGEMGNGCGQSFYVHEDRVYPIGDYVPCPWPTPAAPAATAPTTAPAAPATTAPAAPATTAPASGFAYAEGRQADMLAAGFDASAAGLPECVGNYGNYPCADHDMSEYGDRFVGAVVIDDGYGDRWIVRFPAPAGINLPAAR